MGDTPVAGEAIPADSAVIEVRVAELRRPIRADIRLFGRLATMPVSIRYPAQAPAEADMERWRRDWPAAGVTDPSLRSG